MYFIFQIDALEIEEPQGFADIVLNMKRDDNWHGIFFEASASELAFYGIAAEYLRNKKETEGMKADVTFRALQACGIYDEPEVILEGKLDFGKYSESCGGPCLVKIPVEQTGCLMTLRNRYDQKVDLDSQLAFNKASVLQQYDKLNFVMELPPKELQAAVDGSVADAGYIIEIDQINPLGGSLNIFRPNYDIERYNNIETGQLQAISNWDASQAANIEPITPQVLFEDNITCFDGNFDFAGRMKGTLNLTGSGALFHIKRKLIKWDGTGDIFTNGTIIQEVLLFDGLPTPPTTPITKTFDNTITTTVTIEDGFGFYDVVEFGVSNGTMHFNVQFDKETYFTLSAVKICPATDANVYAINETLSRVTETITDKCLKVKSDYYGRTDSQPYTSDDDGCGSLRVVTSGLKIRRAENAAFFVSLKDLFDGLRGIDNIGMGMEVNPFISGYDWLRIEPVEYFYQDIEILALPFVPEAEITIQEQLHYGGIDVGYQKWEVERINGLDEPNSNRKYRTGLSSVNNQIDITSKFIAGSYPIEVTRQQSFADTGAADTTYDNETFIICIERDAYGFHVEQGNISNAANVFSPQTLYNWRIRPFSNLMRWFKSIANSYPNIVDSANKLFFAAGTGNYLAEGQLAGSDCKLENGVKAENRDLSKYDFANDADAKPLWKPEYATLKYPLSVADYRTLKATPFGYISFQCGTGEWKKGFIQNIRYRLNRGDADFILKLKYE